MRRVYYFKIMYAFSSENNNYVHLLVDLICILILNQKYWFIKYNIYILLLTIINYSIITIIIYHKSKPHF